MRAFSGTPQNRVRRWGVLATLEAPAGCSIRTRAPFQPSPHVLSACPLSHTEAPSTSGQGQSCPAPPWPPRPPSLQATLFRRLPASSLERSPPWPCPRRKCAQHGPGVPGVRSGTFAWERSENRGSIGGRGRVREAGPGTLPDRLTQTLWEAEKLPARWP